MKVTQLENETNIEITRWDKVREWWAHIRGKCWVWCAFCITESEE